MNKYEKLIEYVNNDEDAKAADLFHEIVVEKSRDIYESLMDSEDEFGGDQADELINDISSDETGMREDEESHGKDVKCQNCGTLNTAKEIWNSGTECKNCGSDVSDADYDGERYTDKHPRAMDEDDDDEGMAPEMGGEFGAEEGEADLEDRVVDLEDQLDALMAEFDSVMGDEEGGEEMGMEPGMDDMGGDDMGMDDMGGEELDMQGRFDEAVSLTKVTKGISNSTESEGTNKKSINADNSGKKGSVAKPHPVTGTEAKGQANPTVKPGDGTTEPRESKVKEPKKTGEAEGTNKKSLNGS